MAMLNNQMVYNFSFSHLGNCGTGVDFILATFPWQLGFLDSHSLTNFSWWNPTWVAALRPFQSTVVFATQKTTKFSRGLRGFWWFSDGFLVLFLPFFEVFVPFPSTLCRWSHHLFRCFAKGSNRQEKDKGPSKASKESASLAAERRPSRRLEGVFFGVGLAVGVYPLVMTNIAIEHDHRNSGFTHWKWWIFPWFSCW